VPVVSVIRTVQLRRDVTIPVHESADIDVGVMDNFIDNEPQP
jgi:hypothetical protein